MSAGCSLLSISHEIGSSHPQVFQVGSLCPFTDDVTEAQKAQEQVAQPERSRPRIRMGEAGPQAFSPCLVHAAAALHHAEEEGSTTGQGGSISLPEKALPSFRQCVSLFSYLRFPHPTT